MAESKNIRDPWRCVGLTLINGNPFFKVKLQHKFKTTKYKVVVDGLLNEVHEFNNYKDADNKYQEITKKLNHQFLIK